MRRFILALAAALIAGAAHAQSVNVTVNTNVAGTYRGSNDLGTAQFTLNQALQPAISLVPGVGLNQADRMFADNRTLAASASESLDLAGTLADPLGAPSAVFVTVKLIRICADTANTNNVVVGGAASNGFVGPFGAAAHTIAVRPGGCFLWVSPKTGPGVVASTGDLFQIANSGGTTTVTYSILLVGTSS